MSRPTEAFENAEHAITLVYKTLKKKKQEAFSYREACERRVSTRSYSHASRTPSREASYRGTSSKEACELASIHASRASRTPSIQACEHAEP